MGIAKNLTGTGRSGRGKIPIATKSAKGRSLSLTAELLVNMYAEAAPDGARSKVAAIGCPGLSLFSSIGTGFGDYIRGLYYVTGNQTLWCVVGLTLYKISSAGTATNIGTIGGYGRVSMADNGVELVIVSEAITYVVTLASDTLTPVTDSDFPNADTVAFLGGYFVFNNNQSGSDAQLFWSSLYSGGAYDALDFATAENVPDDLVAVWRDHDRLLLFGDVSTESWFLSGDADATFAPYKGSTVNRGLGARWSVANVDNRVFFLDESGVIRVADGQGTRVSTHAIENEIAQGNWRHDDANAYDGAVASSYIEEGHEFYVLTVPGTGTFVYDAATGLWHKRKSRGLEHSRASFHVQAFGKILCGDTETGKLYEQKLSYYDEAGEYLIAEAQFPAITQEGNRFRIHELELFVEQGVGLSDADINDAYQDVVGACNILGDWSTQTSAADNAWSGITYGDEFVAAGGNVSPNVMYSSDAATWTGATAVIAGTDSCEYTGDTYQGFEADGFTALTDIGFNDDGTIMFHGAQDFNVKINAYTLSTPYLLSTATYTATSTTLNGMGSVLTRFEFGSSGGKVFTINSSGAISRYNCSTAYDVTAISGSIEQGFSNTDGVTPEEFKFNEAGTKLYISQSTSIYEYAIGTPWDLSTGTTTNTTSYNFSGDGYSITSINGFTWAHNGSVLIILHNSRYARAYTASTPYDMSTISYQAGYDLRTIGSTGEGTLGSTALTANPAEFVVGQASNASVEESVFKFVIGGLLDSRDVAWSGSTYAIVGANGGAYGGPSTWFTNDLTSNDAWVSVCWFSFVSKFVAVASSGVGNLVATSSDGETWTEQTETTGFNAVAASPTACIMVGTNGIKRTTNGTSFTSITEPADRNWTGITYSSTRARWVIVCNDGTDNRAAYSDDDGLTWTQATTPADYNWNSVEFGAGYFVAVADTGTGQRIMRSQFGDVWELVDSPADNGWNDLAWSGDSLCLFAAVSDSGTGNRVMISAKDSNAASATSGDAFGFASAARDPQIMLDVHGCGNRVPDVTQQWRSMGLEGEYCKRVKWHRLGQHRTFTPRFTISAPVKRVIIDAVARISWDG